MKARGRNSARDTRLGMALAFILILLSALPSQAVVTGQCVQARGGNSCTANDVTFVLVGLGGRRTVASMRATP